MKELLKLFATFFRVGLFTFGGGYAMLPIIEREVAEKNKWVSKEEILDIFSMSQCTPGVIAVNTATFIGNKIKGFSGALFATLGALSPSVIIISIIAGLISNFTDIELVQHAFAGIRVAVAALVLSSSIRMFRSAVKSPEQIGIFLGSFVLVTFFGSSPIIIIIVSAVVGLFCIDLSKLNPEKGSSERRNGE